VWRRIQRQVVRRPASALTETPGAFLLQARLRGLGAGDVVLSLEQGALVIRGEVQQTHVSATFNGVYSCRFELPANIDVKGLSFTRNGDVINVHVPKASLAREE
jgi:HSP20 family molecular chaperone IbpA